MLSIQRLYIDLQLAPSAEPNLLQRRVQFETPEMLLFMLPSKPSDAEEERFYWEIAEIHWIEIMLQSLRTYYGILGFPPWNIVDGSSSRDPAAMSHWVS